MHPGTLFLPIVLKGSRVYAQNEPGSNVTNTSNTLVQKLGISTMSFKATYTLATEAKGI